MSRLLYSLIFRKNLTKLYAESKTEELHTPPYSEQTVCYSNKIFESYPELATEAGIIFHSDFMRGNDNDLVCAPKLVAGFKTGFSINERTCRELCTESYELYVTKSPDLNRE